MSLLNLFGVRSGSTPLPPSQTAELVPASSSEQAAIVARYKHLRTLKKKLNSQLTKRLSKDVLEEGGRKLGMLRKGIFMFDSEHDSNVLMEYCIFDVRRNGRNAVEQYLIDVPPDSASDEMVCLESMRSSRYTLFVVDSVHPGLGITIHDLVSREKGLVVDIGFGSSAQSGGDIGVAAHVSGAAFT